MGNVTALVVPTRAYLGQLSLISALDEAGYYHSVKQRAILSRLGVETASNSFHLSMSLSSVLAGDFWSDLYGHDL